MRAMSFCEIRLVAKARALGGVEMGRTFALDAATATLMSTVGVLPMTLSLQLISSMSRRSINAMSKTPLTEKQEKVYRFLVEEMSSGFPPTVREICAATGIKSTSTVHAILNALEEEGYIVRDAKSSRAIRLDIEYDSAMVPVVGKITAGQPILAIEEIEDYIPYPSKDADGLFALRVSGLSMRDAGILDGDIIIADKNASCRSGDIVIGMDG